MSGAMTISLDPMLPSGSSDPTRTPWASRPSRPASRPHVSLFGLAPGGVCLALDVATEAVSSYLAVSPLPADATGGLFSVALSLRSPPVAVSDHPALWSSDFPPSANITERGHLYSFDPFILCLCSYRLQARLLFVIDIEPPQGCRLTATGERLPSAQEEAAFLHIPTICCLS